MKSQDEFEERMTEFGKALRANDSMADSVRIRIESELPVVLPDPVGRSASSRGSFKIGDISMRQRITLGGITVAAMVALAFIAFRHSTSVVFAEVAMNVQRATSYSLEVVVRGKDSEIERPLMTEKIFWQSPGTYRMERKLLPANAERRSTAGESPLPDGLAEVAIVSTDRPGIDINHLEKSYNIEEAQRGYQSPLMMLVSLGSYKGKAKKNLGTRNIAGVKAEGFVLEFADFEPSAGEGTLEAWIDTKKQLPVRLTVDMNDVAFVMTFQDIKWNEPLSEDLFDSTPPQGYTNKTQSSEDRATTVAKITDTFKLYAELSGGHYPKVKMVYGDVTLNDMRKFSGYEGPVQEEWYHEKAYGRIQEVSGGLPRINTILRNNAAASYHGIEVGPNDANKVLMQWELPDGQIQRIYGDLREEVVPAEEAK